MFNTIVYFLGAYLAVAAVFVIAKRRLVPHRQKERRKAFAYRLGLALLMLPWLPYLVVAAQTALFGRALLPSVYRAFDDCGGMCGDSKDKILTYWILGITPFHAKVYLVQPCTGGMLGEKEQGRTGEVLELKRTPRGWRLQDWDGDGSWSDCGSAEGNVFPPDPQAKEF